MLMLKDTVVQDIIQFLECCEGINCVLGLLVFRTAVQCIASLPSYRRFAIKNAALYEHIIICFI